MLKFAKRAVVVSALFSAGIVSAGEVIASGGFVVTGVIKPTACSVVFEGGDVIDYKNIDKKHLEGEGYYKTSKTDVKPFSVTCKEPASVSIKFVDAKADTVALEGSGNFGLGVTKDNKKIGYHYFTLKNDKLKVENGKNAVADVIYGRSATNSKLGWEKEITDNVIANYYYTPVNKESLQPVPFTAFKSAIGSHIAIDRGLKITQEERLDGYVTMELHYI